ncbi:GNAT family N-acetyltransferase [Pontibacter ruber]|uniref:GNAT family N-acetyltransferase n=1 Tax=Pontibacter ruber TaxID=1343895 RepID=A0ABW5CWW3_9BACT|nr:GNAT family N-acetyltransferase [Pontibacter ruber]
MENYRFAFLSEKELPELHQTFLKAFADYYVPIQLTWEQFEAKIKREGVEPTFCAAAFHGDEMAGFILTGLGEWLRRPTAYNGGTGVVPEHRGQNLSQRLYEFMLPKLRESGMEQCLLEVLQQNEPAKKVYTTTGFRTTRVLDCFRTPKADVLLRNTAADVTVEKALKPDWATYTSFWDIQPSWQNTVTALRRCPAEKVVLEARLEDELVGYIIFYPSNGAVAQLAVDPTHRAKGIGTLLLQEALQLIKAPAVMLINVDEAGASIISFLERRHFKCVLVQEEMLLTL